MRNTLIGAACACLVLLLMGAAAVGGRIMTLDDSVTAPVYVGAGYTTLGAVVAGSGTLTAVYDTTHHTLYAVSLPSTLEGTSLKYRCALVTAGTFNYVEDEAGDDCVNVTAASKVTAPQAGACAVAVAACRFLKLEVASQTGDSTITLIMK